MLGLVAHVGAGWKAQMEHHQAVPLGQLSGAGHIDYPLAQPGQHAAPAHWLGSMLYTRSRSTGETWSLVKLHQLVLIPLGNLIMLVILDS